MVVPGAANAATMQGVQFLPRIWVTRLMGRVYRRRMSGTG